MLSVVGVDAYKGSHSTNAGVVITSRNLFIPIELN